MDALLTLDNGTRFFLETSFRLKRTESGVGTRDETFEIVSLDASGNTVARESFPTEDDARYRVAMIRANGCDGCGRMMSDLYSSADGDASYCETCDNLYYSTDVLVQSFRERDGIAWTTIFPEDVPNPVVGKHPLQGNGNGQVRKDGTVDATDGDFYSVSPGFESVADFDSWYLAEYATTEAKDTTNDAPSLDEDRKDAIRYALRTIRDLADGIFPQNDSRKILDDAGTIHNLASLAILSLDALEGTRGQ